MIMLVIHPSKWPSRLVKKTHRTGLSKESAGIRTRYFWRKTTCFSRNLRLGFLQPKLDLGRISLHG